MKSSRGLRLGTTLFSFTNEFHARQYSTEQLILKVAELGLGPGLEIVGFQSFRDYPEISDKFAEDLKELLSSCKLEPSCLAINADINIGKDRTLTVDELVVYHEAQIRAAAKLGFPVARCQFAAGPEVIRRLVPLAERLNVKLGLEIHAPEAVDSPLVLSYREMYVKVNSPYLGFIPDFGASAKALPPSFLAHFRKEGVPEKIVCVAEEVWATAEGNFGARLSEYHRRARQTGAAEADIHKLNMLFAMLSKQKPSAWIEIMPQVVHVHGKFYEFDKDGNEAAISYAELLPVFRDGGYKGFISSEWEGTAFTDDNGFEAVQAHHALCRRILARA